MHELLHGRVGISVDASLMMLTLARPDDGNAFDLAMAQGIRDAAQQLFDAATNGHVRAAVLAADGAVFCVGGDLAYFASAHNRGDRLGQVATLLHEAIELMTSTPAPIVTALHGTAAGGGVGLALAGDVIIAGPKAKFKLAYTAVGLTPDCGASWLLPRRIGQARALDLALTNRVLSAAEAERWGLVSRVTESDNVLEEAIVTAKALASGPQEALAMTKHLLWTSMSRPLSAQLDLEAHTIARLVDSGDGHEGVDAFLAKRHARFG
jgi:2-(1,2-epoxy-1,2-dihydrophenyl)acetyl-CoA isomerase